MELDGSWALKRKLNKHQGEPSGKKSAIGRDTSNAPQAETSPHVIIQF